MSSDVIIALENLVCEFTPPVKTGRPSEI